jgi:hypothetical protein
VNHVVFDGSHAANSVARAVCLFLLEKLGMLYSVCVCKIIVICVWQESRLSIFQVRKN